MNSGGQSLNPIKRHNRLMQKRNKGVNAKCKCKLANLTQNVMAQKYNFFKMLKFTLVIARISATWLTDRHFSS